MSTPHLLDLRSIARALGGEISGRQILAPGPGHRPQDRSLSIRIEPGAPAGFIVHAGRCFALELKAEGGRASDKQLATIAALREGGAFTCIAEGLDRALACLEAWGILRGRSR